MIKQRNEVEKCKENLRLRLEIAAGTLKNSLLKAHGEKRRNGAAFVFDDCHEIDNRKLWEPIRTKWRRSAARALADALPTILRFSRQRERAAEKQGVLAGELFARAFIQVFCWSTPDATTSRQLIIPPGLGSGEELYQAECQWIESALLESLPGKAILRLRKRESIRLMAARRKAICLASDEGKKGEAYCRRLKELGLKTPTPWQQEHCPSDYLLAWNHATPRKKWHQRISGEKSKLSH